MGQKPDISQKLEQDLGLEMQQTTLEKLWGQDYFGEKSGLFYLDETGSLVGLLLEKACPPPEVLAMPQNRCPGNVALPLQICAAPPWY